MISPATAFPATPTRPEPNAGAATAPAAAQQPRPAPPVFNPHLRIDTTLSLVVLEFRDDAGAVQHSIPTPREIAAYRDQPQEEQQAPALDVSG